MEATAVLAPRSASGRVVYAALAAALLGTIVLELVRHGTGYWQFAAFGFGPDLALFYGIGRGLAQGQLHPRAVASYNAVHRYWGPLALCLLAALGLVPLGFFVGALAWGFHISVDRAVGYRLRGRDGFQR